MLKYDLTGRVSDDIKMGETDSYGRSELYFEYASASLETLFVEDGEVKGLTPELEAEAMKELAHDAIMLGIIMRDLISDDRVKRLHVCFLYDTDEPVVVPLYGLFCDICRFYAKTMDKAGFVVFHLTNQKLIDEIINIPTNEDKYPFIDPINSVSISTAKTFGHDVNNIFVKDGCYKISNYGIGVRFE